MSRPKTAEELEKKRIEEEKREEERWRKLDEDFAALHENERQVRIKRAVAKGVSEERATMVVDMSRMAPIEEIASALNTTVSEIEYILKG